MSPTDGDPGSWGPLLTGGRRFPLLRRVLTVLGTGVIATMVAVSSLGFLVYQKAEAGIAKIGLETLESSRPGSALNVLVVGSDARDGLSEAERRRLSLGSFDGQRSDTVILVSVTPDRSGVNVVSFPRDLIVHDDDGRRHKLTETFFHGPDGLVDVIRDNFGVPVNHYVEVSITGFIGVVEALGSVEVCLDEPLRDRRSGADFTAGCHRMSPEQALAYVRSRQGARGDFDRIERQQIFLKAMLNELISARLLSDVPRLLRVVDDVARTVTTDDGLGVNRMRTLAEDLRGLADGSIPMTFVPGFTRRLDDGKDYVIPYAPGARALFAAIRDGQVLAPRGTAEQRAETAVTLWSGGRAEAAVVVEGTLNWGGFRPVPNGVGPVDAGAVTVVYAAPGAEEKAGWVAAILGVEVTPLPATVELPEGTEVAVAVGDDALASYAYLEPPPAQG